MNQKEKVLKYINDYGSITSWEAYSDLGIMQLRSKNRRITERWILIQERMGAKKEQIWRACKIYKIQFAGGSK